MRHPIPSSAPRPVERPRLGVPPSCTDNTLAEPAKRVLPFRIVLRTDIMALELAARLTNLVITAEYHHPTILSPSFLSACGIVPETWSAVDFSESDTARTVEYHNGVFWSLDQNSLIVEDDRPFDLDGEIEIHNLASNYLREVRAIQYRALGLNFYLALPARDPHGWIANRFMPPSLHAARNHGIRVLPSFAVPVGDATATITFGGPETDFEDPPLDDAVLISVHVLHQGFSDAVEVLSALSSWPATHAAVVQAVSLLIGGQ